MDAQDAFGRAALEVAVEAGCEELLATVCDKRWHSSLDTVRTLLEMRAAVRNAAVEEWRASGSVLRQAAANPAGFSICALLEAAAGRDLRLVVADDEAAESCEAEEQADVALSAAEVGAGTSLN